MAKALVNSSGKVLLRDGKVATSDSVDCCCTTTGACCHDDESCEILSEAACNATVDGVYQGDNTVCDPNPCVTGECGCNRTVAVSVTSVVSITREGDDYMSMTTSFSHTFASADNEGSCFFDWTDFNSCIDGCSNDGRYPDPDARSMLAKRFSSGGIASISRPMTRMSPFKSTSAIPARSRSIHATKGRHFARRAISAALSITIPFQTV